MVSEKRPSPFFFFLSENHPLLLLRSITPRWEERRLVVQKMVEDEGGT